MRGGVTMYECVNCGGALRFDIPSQQLHCDHCESDFDPQTYRVNETAGPGSYTMETGPAATYSVCVYTCPNCGGELLTTDESITGFCPYCGSFSVLTKKMREETRPQKIIPFRMTKEDCKKAYKKKTAGMIYTPRKMKDEDALETFRPIYMPFWMYDYNFDGDYKVVGTKEYTQGHYEITEIHQLTGQVNSTCHGVSFDGSSSLDDEISQAVIPYDTEEIKDFQPSYLCGFYADSGDVASQVYQKEADQFAMESLVERLGQEEAYKDFDTVRASGKKPKAEDLSMKKEPAKSVLFPMWFLTYRKGSRVAYSVVNGQTGKVTADLPVDIGRFLIGAVLTAVPIYFLLNLFLAVIPRYLLALSGLPAMVVSAIYMISVTTIYKRDFKLEDAGIKSLWTKTRAEEEKKKQEEVEKLFNSAMAGLVILVILWGICIFTEMRLDSALSSLIMIIAAIVMGVSVRSGHRHWNQKRLVNDSYVLLAAIILSRLLLLANPHYDIYYYGGTVFLFAFILYTLIQLIREYNLMTTRPLPQLDRQGGDTSAPV